MSKILVGSRAFFSCYPDFNSKDEDWVEIIETNEFNQIRQIKDFKNNRCIFQMKRHSCTQDYIDWALKCSLGMVIGKFLVPEFAAAIGLSIADLKQLSPLLEKLDDAHKYEENIFNAYLENNSFTLTDEQRNLAYQSYKNSRQ